MGNQLTTPMLRKWFSIISFHNSANLKSPNLSLVTTAAVALLHSEKYIFEKQGNMAYRVREIRTTILFHRCQFEISQPLPRTRAANVNITKVKDNFAQKSAPKYQTILAVGVMVLWFLDFFWYQFVLIPPKRHTLVFTIFTPTKHAKKFQPQNHYCLYVNIKYDSLSHRERGQSFLLISL